MFKKDSHNHNIHRHYYRVGKSSAYFNANYKYNEDHIVPEDTNEIIVVEENTESSGQFKQ